MEEPSVFASNVFPAMVKVVPSTLVSTLILFTYELALRPCVTTAFKRTTANKSNCIHEFCKTYSDNKGVQLPAEFKLNRLYAVEASGRESENDDAEN